MEVIVGRHHVGSDSSSGLSPLQKSLLDSTRKVRIASAPTGAGKSYVFQKAMMRGEKILFIVPTRRLADNLISGLTHSLNNDEGWSYEKIREKIALWSSDETKRLRDSGERHIMARRTREVEGLNFAIEGGEMIVAIPEVVSTLLLRPFPAAGLSDVGIFHLLRSFDHIVFDEFHTITERGFGFAGVVAKCAATFPETRAKVSFLSATPIEIFPVLSRLGIDEEKVDFLKEEIKERGRVVHGDVTLQLMNEERLFCLVEKRLPDIMTAIREGFQVVIIYNNLKDLQCQIDSLESLFAASGIASEQVLLIDSIDDSRTGKSGSGIGAFAVGREKAPESYDILIATASVELGVTFRSNLLIMEPGFQPMNFLQRYGRAARGDYNGKVVVRTNHQLQLKHPWFHALTDWVKENEGKRVLIDEMTLILSKQVQHRFSERPIDSHNHFGSLSERAEYIAGLYWNLLIDHFSSGKHRRHHLIKHQPEASKRVYGLLKTVRQMTSDGIFGESVSDWCDRFCEEAKRLRDIGETIRVIEENRNGSAFYAGILWLRRFTDIMDRYPVMMAEDGSEEIRIKGRLSDKMRESGRFVQATLMACFPHTPYPALIKDDSKVVANWMIAFRDSKGVESLAWEIHPKAMAAALKLTQLTGLVVKDEHHGLETQNTVL